jgi:hypothetical protein
VISAARFDGLDSNQIEDGGSVGMASPSDSLKKELLQPQNERGKLMKWKILLVSGAGSAALGFSANPAHVHFRRRDIARGLESWVNIRLALR